MKVRTNMINTQKIEIPNTDNCLAVTSVFHIHSHTFDASKMFIIDVDDLEKVETQIKEKLMLLRDTNSAYNKRSERSAIVEVLKNNARMMLTHNVK